MPTHSRDPRGTPEVRAYRRRPTRAAAAALAAALAAPGAAPAPAEDAQEPAKPPSATRPPLDFHVLKTDKPVTGPWEFADPVSGARRVLDLRPASSGAGLAGVQRDDGREVLALAPKSEGIGYQGELKILLAPCGQESVPVSDFLPIGDQVLVRLEARPPEAGCPFLEDPQTARWVVAPAAGPVRLRGLGEITSEKTREQIGLGGHPGGTPSPRLADAVSVEPGAEMKYLGRVRSLDGSIWMEVEAVVSPGAGIEPPRGYLPAESLRVAATLTLLRAAPAGAPSR
jgi:hypothetical protein